MTDVPDSGQEPTGDLSFLEGHDPAGLAVLAAAGIGEGDFATDEDLWVPPDLVELYEVMEWENAVAAGEDRDLPHPDIGVPPPNTPGVERSTPFHSRADWGARPPRSRTAIRNPEGCTCHYGGPSPWGTSVDRGSAAAFLRTADHARCPTIMRAYQRFHMDTRGWSDFAYNSGDCPHGHRYEGRGPGIRSAAQGTTAGNDRSYASCSLIGDGDPITDPLKFAFLDEGTPGRLLALRWGHRDWKSTACPGEPIYAWRLAGFPTPEDDDMSNTEAEIAAGCAKALRHMTRAIPGVGGSQNADAAWAKYVYDAARESLAEPDVTAAAIAAAIVDQLPEGTVSQAVVEAGVRAVLVEGVAAAIGE